MKKIFNTIFISIITIILFSCSSSDDDSTTNPDGGGNENALLIKSVIGTQSFDEGDQYVYENNLLKYVYLSSCSGALNYFEYENGKIKYHYTKGFVTEFDPNNFDLVSFLNDASKVEYIYQNGKVSSKKNEIGETIRQYSYNQSGNLIEVENRYNGFLSFKVLINYNNENISNIAVQDYGSSGSDYTVTNYTFVFDDKVNPLKKLSDDFGLISLQTCRGGLDVIDYSFGLLIFKNNPIQVIEDGTTSLSVSYQYNSDNHPTNVNYTEFHYNGEYSDILSVNY